ncbi:hypothetical protein PFICI_02876 [Pestalotiopsis fici W106-1]|uniref:DUF7708 domain-containing protein n=1 Tax=Pestalotiopsis fici (strain W106-1 / CGMCC3.15140) TaxID=1229662 RepID=W3XHZ4_PESFW|nr:uncharacterized protein PFICI_02876 [Pestalotiopsis fici W106-1]ETS84851.1 hypothetical protein PFICI_02876 [Pestalotiopsis fici W106-1]
MSKYNSSQTHSKAKAWLRKFSSKVKIYGDILDVFVQHHPEYVSLVWGAMKLVFTSFVNHDKTITKLAEGLSQVADELPTIEFLSQLYPTERMRTAIAEVNAYILRFLIRAHDWYQEGTWKHILHSVTRPSELRYDDILDAISQKTATIRNLASCGQQGMIYAMRDQLGEVKTRLEQLATAATLQSASMVSMNSKLTDLQFSQIMRSIPESSIMMPEKVLDYLQAQAARRRASQSRALMLPYHFVNSPKLRKWTQSDASAMILVKGNFHSRQPLRYFCFDIIKQLRDAGIHALLAIKIPVQDPQQAIVTCADILRYLIRQGLQITQNLQTESSMSLTCTRIHGNLAEGQLFQILESILCDVSEQVYLVVDLELLNQDFTHPQGFSWLEAFLGFFERLSARKPTHRVKVMLLNYGSDFPFALSSEDFAKFVLRAKAGSNVVAQQQAWRSGQPRSRGSFRLRPRKGGSTGR